MRHEERRRKEEERLFFSISASFSPSLLLQHVKVSRFDQIASLNDMTLYQGICSLLSRLSNSTV